MKRRKLKEMKKDEPMYEIEMDGEVDEMDDEPMYEIELDEMKHDHMEGLNMKWMK
jgi:hypothetical protein